jgi:hypothetical protein
VEGPMARDNFFVVVCASTYYLAGSVLA